MKESVLVCAVPAVRFSQRDKTFFLAAVPAQQLLRLARVDHWDPLALDRSQNGYQRRPDQKRLAAIARFIAEPDSYFSTGGLLNSRIPVDSPGSPLSFECAWTGESDLAFGVLRFYEAEQPLWVVDMQHRLEGLRLALAANPSGQLSELPVAVTIASGLTRAEEINEFLQINTKQKKVSTALARRALALLNISAAARAALSRDGKLWEARGPVIIDLLMDRSPIWAGRILPPNISKREMPTGICRETSFVSSLRPVLADSFLGNLDDRSLVAQLESFWEALRGVWPEAFLEPERHVIQQNPGVVPLHRLLPRIISEATVGATAPDARAIGIVVAPWRSLDSDYWRKGGSGAGAIGSSEGAFTQITRSLERLLR